MATASKATPKIKAIPENELKDIVQDFLRVNQEMSAMKSENDARKQIIMEQMNIRGIEHGPVPQYDGPNGGITLGQTRERNITIDSVKNANLFSDEALSNIIKPTVDTKALAAHVKLVVLQKKSENPDVKEKELETELMDKVAYSVEKKPKITSVYSRTGTDTSTEEEG